MSHFSGVFAALATPVNEDGTINYALVDRLLEFVLEAGVDGVCIAGATGEYVHFSREQRSALTAHIARRLRGRAALLTAIGASTTDEVLALGRSAIDAGSDALLVPMPHFFRYQQEDLETFSRTVAGTLQSPCLLYNLPSFTNPIEPGLAVRLLRTEPYIVGIKDSSGNIANVNVLAQARGPKLVSLLVGNDEIIEQALGAGWDGIVSGIASMCPELIVKVYHSSRGGDCQAARRCLLLLNELLAQVIELPVPWAIRAGLSVRGFPMGRFALPLSASRTAQIDRFREWFRAWLCERTEELARHPLVMPASKEVDR